MNDNRNQPLKGNQQQSQQGKKENTSSSSQQQNRNIEQENPQSGSDWNNYNSRELSDNREERRSEKDSTLGNP